MLETQLLDSLPLWSVYVLTAFFLLLGLEAGFRLGKIKQKRWPDRAESEVGAMVGATLALLAFLLTFATSFAFEVFNERRLLIVQEANAIGSAYMQAGLLPEPLSEKSRLLFKEYVNLRLAAMDRTQTIQAIARSEAIQDELWSFVEPIAKGNPDPIIALYITSLDNVMDIHTQRLAAELGIRVPATILVGLYGIAFLTMLLVGVHFAYEERWNILALILVVLVLSAVFFLIVDLDRSHQVGLLKISQKALIDLQENLKSVP